jgi:hypothetical protein
MGNIRHSDCNPSYSDYNQYLSLSSEDHDELSGGSVCRLQVNIFICKLYCPPNCSSLLAIRASGPSYNLYLVDEVSKKEFEPPPHELEQDIFTPKSHHQALSYLPYSCNQPSHQCMHD